MLDSTKSNTSNSVLKVLNTDIQKQGSESASLGLPPVREDREGGSPLENREDRTSIEVLGKQQSTVTHELESCQPH